jgi:maltose O-acetyltransferase
VSKPDPAPGERTPYQKMLAGEPYIADDPQIAAAHHRAMVLLDGYNRDLAASAADRRKILVELLGTIGPDTEIRPPLFCDYGDRLHFGARTFVNFGLMALDVAPIVIGDDVQIGPYVQLLTPTHPIDARARREKWESARPITIGDNVWLGGGVVVLPGVTIGRDTVVGAGSVVTRDIPAGVVAHGNPARISRDAEEVPQ